VELLAGTAGAVLVAVFASRLLGRELASRTAIALAAVALAAGLAVYPRQLSRAASRADVGSTRCPQPGAAPSAREPAIVSELAAFQALRREIPSQDTYALLGPSGTVRFCAYTWLLPRVAVDPRHQPDWVVLVGLDPSAADLAVTGVRQVAPGVYLGRAAP
jgi:hypothetical protein